jgi:hypothetical protein
MEEKMDVKYPDITVQLTGCDGNAFAIIGAVKNALRKAKVPEQEVDAYMDAAMGGDYDNLLVVTMKTVNVE